MDKSAIIDEILKTAQENGGKPLGQERFFRETGIGPAQWLGRYWMRWSEALIECGFEPNKYTTSYTDEYILEKYALLIRELRRVPIKLELKAKARSDKTFPSHTVFDRLGAKHMRISRLAQFCSSRPEFEDIKVFLNDVPKDRAEDDIGNNKVQKGYVYLVQHGARKEYKIGRTNNPIRREGELNIELPERLQPIHWVETDDPPGIERYWHNRFASKRKNGEWFELTPADLKAFRRWKKIY